MTSLLALRAGPLLAGFVILALISFSAILWVTFLRARSAAREHEAAAAGTTTISEPGVTATKTEKAPRVVTRREFFRQAWTASFLLFLAEFGGASIAFLWPNLKGGFGDVFTVGTVSDIKATIDATNEPFYSGAARTWVVPYNGPGIDAATGVDYKATGVTADGLMPLYQKCVHLGCRVPFCAASQWFECPCHGSKYNKAGEYQLGPAPRGMDRFKIKIEGDNVLVDTGTIILGPPRGTNTIQQFQEGPFCV